jgi:hypothetical protein
MYGFEESESCSIVQFPWSPTNIKALGMVERYSAHTDEFGIIKNHIYNINKK